MRTLPLPSALERSILGLIRAGAGSGYEIRMRLAASPGSVYPALKRLQKAGLIDGIVLTPLGKRVLRAALANIDKDELRRDPETVAARLRFLKGAQITTFLKEYARLCGELAAELRGSNDLFDRHDAAVFAARARWAAKNAR
jgi:DNA-binding PadR family transcriptional regulator